MRNQYYYRRHASGTMSHRQMNTGNKNSTSVEAIAFIATVGVMLAIVIFNVWVNGIH